MKATVEYNQEIHDKLIASLDKEVEKSKKILTEGVKVLEKKVKLPSGREIVIGKNINDKVNSMLTYSFNYTIIKEGELEIEFKSLADKIPLIKQYTEQAMKTKIRSEMKKEFGKDILKIK